MPDLKDLDLSSSNHPSPASRIHRAQIRPIMNPRYK